MSNSVKGGTSHRPIQALAGSQKASDDPQKYFNDLQENIGKLRNDADRKKLADWARGPTSAKTPDIVKQLAWLARQKGNDGVMRFLGKEIFDKLGNEVQKAVRDRIVTHLGPKAAETVAGKQLISGLEGAKASPPPEVPPPKVERQELGAPKRPEAPNVPRPVPSPSSTTVQKETTSSTGERGLSVEKLVTTQAHPQSGLAAPVSETVTSPAPPFRWDPKKPLVENMNGLAALLPEQLRNTFVEKITDPSLSPQTVVRDFGSAFARAELNSGDARWRTAFSAFNGTRTRDVDLFSEFIHGLGDAWIKEPIKTAYAFIPLLHERQPNMMVVLDRMEREGQCTRSELADGLLPNIIQGQRRRVRDEMLATTLNWLGGPRMSLPVLTTCIALLVKARNNAPADDPQRATAVGQALGRSIAQQASEGANKGLEVAREKLKNTPDLLAAFEQGVQQSRTPGRLTSTSAHETELDQAVKAFEDAFKQWKTLSGDARADAESTLQRRLRVIEQLPSSGGRQGQAVYQCQVAMRDADLEDQLAKADADTGDLQDALDRPLAYGKFLAGLQPDAMMGRILIKGSELRHRDGSWMQTFLAGWIEGRKVQGALPRASALSIAKEIRKMSLPDVVKKGLSDRLLGHVAQQDSQAVLTSVARALPVGLTNPPEREPKKTDITENDFLSSPDTKGNAEQAGHDEPTTTVILHPPRIDNAREDRRDHKHAGHANDRASSTEAATRTPAEDPNLLTLNPRGYAKQMADQNEDERVAEILSTVQLGQTKEWRTEFVEGWIDRRKTNGHLSSDTAKRISLLVINRSSPAQQKELIAQVVSHVLPEVQQRTTITINEALSPAPRF